MLPARPPMEWGTQGPRGGNSRAFSLDASSWKSSLGTSLTSATLLACFVVLCCSTRSTKQRSFLYVPARTRAQLLLTICGMRRRQRGAQPERA